MLDYLACLAYGLAAIVSLLAARTAHASGRGRGDMAVWLGGAALLSLLIVVRLADGEDIARGMLRGFAALEGFYNMRMAGQIAALIVLGGLLALGWRKFQADLVVKRGSISAKFIRAAILAMFGFVLLYGLRVISLHAVDSVLYAGPLRLNWLLEAGLVILLSGAAGLYLRHCRKHPKGNAREGMPSRIRRQ